MKLYEVYDNEDVVYFVSELCEGGTLASMFPNGSRRVSEYQLAQITKQILRGLQYLHIKGVAHRDLKLENIMYTSERKVCVKLIDFGFSKTIDPNTENTDCGTLVYQAPEVFDRRYTTKCDLYSLGVIVFMLASCYPPFDGD